MVTKPLRGWITDQVKHFLSEDPNLNTIQMYDILRSRYPSVEIKRTAVINAWNRQRVAMRIGITLEERNKREIKQDDLRAADIKKNMVVEKLLGNVSQAEPTPNSGVPDIVKDIMIIKKFTRDEGEEFKINDIITILEKQQQLRGKSADYIEDRALIDQTAREILNYVLDVNKDPEIDDKLYSFDDEPKLQALEMLKKGNEPITDYGINPNSPD